MLKYDKIDITEGIDLNKTNKSKNVCFVIIGSMVHLLAMAVMIQFKGQQILKNAITHVKKN